MVRPVLGSVLDRLLLGFLVVDGFAIGLVSVAFTYQRFGGVALPVAALAAGVVNAALLWLAAGLTATPWRYGPLAAWGLVVVIAGGLPGPGGDADGREGGRARQRAPGEGRPVVAGLEGVVHPGPRHHR